MFCPNCGRNCGDDNFCADCGTRLKENCNQATSGGVQQVTDAPADSQKEQDSYEMPYGKYGDASNLIEFTKGFLVVHYKPLFRKKIVATIRYDQLTKVIYSRHEARYGRMHFCWNDNGSEKEISISFSSHYDWDCFEQIFHLFMVIKSIAPATATFTLDIPPSNAGDIDFDDYFGRFSPYRGRAIDPLMRAYALTKETATAMINTEFEHRQQEIYAAEPSLAIRDMNRVLAERRRLIEEDEREELRKKLMRARMG